MTVADISDILRRHQGGIDRECDACTLATEIERLRAQRNAAQTDADRLYSYADHFSDCAWSTGEECTCGVYEALAAHDEAVAQR